MPPPEAAGGGGLGCAPGLPQRGPGAEAPWELFAFSHVLKTFLGLSAFKSSWRKAARSNDHGTEAEFCKSRAVRGTFPARSAWRSLAREDGSTYPAEC